MHCSIQRASDGYTTSPSGFFSSERLQYGQLPSRTLPTKDITHSDFSNPYFYIHETFKKKFGIEMDRRQFGTNPLPKPTLTYCWLDGQQPISVKLYKQDVSNFIHKKTQYRLHNVCHVEYQQISLSWPQWVNPLRLIRITRHFADDIGII